jgi:hypothetical protein
LREITLPLGPEKPSSGSPQLAKNTGRKGRKEEKHEFVFLLNKYTRRKIQKQTDLKSLTDDDFQVLREISSKNTKFQFNFSLGPEKEISGN